MAKTFKYMLYDYKVVSDIQLDIDEVEFDKEDLSFMTKDGYCDYKFYNDQKWEIFNDKDHTEIIILGIGTYLIQAKSITFQPYKDYDPRGVLLYLLGFVFGVYLVRQNRYSIHGSVVNIDDTAIIFAGDSGAGKSSISRGFITRGYKLLSDDVALLNKDEFYTIVPSFPSQKLWIDTAEKFNIETDTNLKTCKEDDKFIIDISKSYHNAKLTLGCIFMLKVSDEPLSIREADINEKLTLLIKHTYLFYLYDELNESRGHFRFMAELASQVRVFIINRPIGINTVDKQIDMVLKQIKMNKM